MREWREHKGRQALRTVEAIDQEISEKREQLQNAKGTETEVYTRIVGYYRSLKNWNRGKRDEYLRRVPFDHVTKMPELVHDTGDMSHETPRRKTFIPEQKGAHPVIAGFTMLQQSKPDDDWELGERQGGVEDYETCESCQ